MANIDALRDKILKLGQKQKIGAVLKYIDNPNDDVRMATAMALGMIPTYESGMGLIELLRDPSPFVRATACNSAAEIHARTAKSTLESLHLPIRIRMPSRPPRELLNSLRTT